MKHTIVPTLLLLASLSAARAQDKSIHMVHKHTGEEINITFMENGEYVRSALKKLNHFLRDWRNDDEREMDPDLFNLLADVYKKVGASEKIHVVSSYRSPGTNAMLRRRSRGVAKNSQHINGKAMDFYIPGITTAQIREVALKMERGGVGFYPRAGTAFIHLDTGSVRMWPKMSRDQLARVFPDGKTVHIPRDGKPMGQFDVALASLKARGGSYSRGGGEEENESGTGFFAALFGLGKNKRDNFPKENRADEDEKPIALEKPLPAEKQLPERQTLVAGVTPQEDRPKAPLKIIPLVPKTKFIAPVPMAMPRFREKLKTELAQNTPQLDNITLKTAPLPPVRDKTDDIKVAAISPKVALAPTPPEDLRAKASTPSLPPQDPRGKSSQKIPTPVLASKPEPTQNVAVEAPRKPLVVSLPKFNPSFSFNKPSENPYAFR